MKKLDAYEKYLLAAFEAGELKSTSPSKAHLAKFKAAASATFIKDKRINIRLSSPDLRYIQARSTKILNKYASSRRICLSISYFIYSIQV